MTEELDPLEVRCLALAARGLSSENITRETDIPADRVESALKSAMEKLRTQNLAGAIFRAARLELI